VDHQRASDEHQRREVFFAGRVQGVGFRYTTRAIASRFEVVGFVENLRDGRVHLVVEGASGVLDEFLAAIGDEMERYITSSQADQSSATGEFDAFEIRH
jgi:acylphosphatase